MAIYDDIAQTVVADRYRVTQSLGAGAFGEVVLATHEVYGIALRQVAIKLFAQDYVTHENAATVFKEAVMLEALAAGARSRREPVHLVMIYDIGVLKDYQYTPFVAMEYIDGGSLEDQLAQAGRFPLQTVVRYILEICAGLRLAHLGAEAIIHRDLKPANVLLTRDHVLKVADFGVAIDRYSAFLQGGMGGTITYSPPESRAAVPPTPAFDIYSLGIMMLEMLMGENPLNQVVQRTKGPEQRVEAAILQAQTQLADLNDPNTGVPFAETIVELRDAPAFQSILKGCLALEPAARFRNAQLLEEALRPLLKTTGQLAPQVFETGRDELERNVRQARQHLEWGELDQAETLLQKVRSSQPNHPQAAFILSLIYEQRGQLEAALREQEQGIRWSPSPPPGGRERLQALQARLNANGVEQGETHAERARRLYHHMLNQKDKK